MKKRYWKGIASLATAVALGLSLTLPAQAAGAPEMEPGVEATLFEGSLTELASYPPNARSAATGRSIRYSGNVRRSVSYTSPGNYRYIVIKYNHRSRTGLAPRIFLYCNGRRLGSVGYPRCFFSGPFKRGDKFSIVVSPTSKTASGSLSWSIHMANRP